MAKKKYRIKWKAVALAAVALALVIALFSWLIGALLGGGKDENANTFTACKLKVNKLQEKLSEVPKSAYAIQDYVFYGESLSFYTSPYELDVANTLVGKQLKLVDVCTGKEVYVDQVEDRLDGQFDLGSLEEGFYELYVVENLLDKRVYTIEPFNQADNTLYTVTRNGKNKKVEVFGTSSLLNSKVTDETDYLGQNYVFIKVTEEALPTDVYDIMLNPGPIVISTDVGSATGETKDGTLIEESQEMYRFALAVKEKLEAKGFKVAISRDGTECLSTYGEGGTVAAGMNASAKYFFSLGMYEVSKKYQGLCAYYSSYVDESIASAIYNNLTENTKLVDSELASCKRANGYDSDFDIREAGGMALGAGNYKGAELNEFAKYNRAGMECVSFEFINTKNTDDCTNWSDDFDNIAVKFAEGIANALAK